MSNVSVQPVQSVFCYLYVYDFIVQKNFYQSYEYFGCQGFNSYKYIMITRRAISRRFVQTVESHCQVGHNMMHFEEKTHTFTFKGMSTIVQDLY